jgi:hypothetical protein
LRSVTRTCGQTCLLLEYSEKMTTNKLEVANTIRTQIGPVAFMLMGASNLLGGEDYLQFKIGSNAKKVTHVTVTLLPSDTYKLTFQRVWGTKVTLLNELAGVYVDNLHDMIELHTGLFLSFNKK